MLQNTSKTIGYQKIMVYKTPPGGGGRYTLSGSWPKSIFGTYKVIQWIQLPYLKLQRGKVLSKNVDGVMVHSLRII